MDSFSPNPQSKASLQEAYLESAASAQDLLFLSDKVQLRDFLLMLTSLLRPLGKIEKLVRLSSRFLLDRMIAMAPANNQTTSTQTTMC